MSPGYHFVGESIQCGDQVCYKFFNQMLKSDVCMLASEDIVLELRAKKENLEKIVHEFEYVTPEVSDIVECCLYKTALHACELVASDCPFLFPTMYRQFMGYLTDYDIDLSKACTSKSRLLTFLGNELLSSFCVDRDIGTVFYRTNASQAYHSNLLNHLSA